MTTLLGACERTPAPPAGPPPYSSVERAAALAKPAPPFIPAAFLGRWAQSSDGCAVGGETRLIVEIDELKFHESSGRVTDLVVNNDRDVAVSASFQGEGESWNRPLRMTLSDDGQTLTIHDPDGAATARVRCP